MSLEGDKVNLVCTVINDVHANHSIQVSWYKNGKLIQPDRKSILLYNETIKDFIQFKSILTLDPVIPNDDGLYTCQAFNHPDLYSESETNLTVECKLATYLTNMCVCVIKRIMKCTKA